LPKRMKCRRSLYARPDIVRGQQLPPGCDPKKRPTDADDPHGVWTARLVAELPAICQQQGFTSPQAAPCRFDSVGVLTSVNSRERMDTC
jgi:hypothetical protein